MNGVLIVSSSRELLWRVPDRRGVGAVLNRHGDIVRHFHPEKLRVVGGPARLRVGAISGGLLSAFLTLRGLFLFAGLAVALLLVVLRLGGKRA